jgi:hypothetical protein
MKKNMGTTDTRMRMFAAVVFILLYGFNIVTGVAGYVLLTLAIIFGITSLLGFCPLYSLLGISTCNHKKQ